MAIELKKLNEEFAYDFLSIPTHSKREFRMVGYIMIWAKQHEIKAQTDDYGNLYLTKGELSEGEYYPCLTAHLDTVQNAHEAYIKEGTSLTIKTSVNKDGKHELRGDGYGLGGDDKCGLLIALGLFQYVDKMKAAFFLEEEIGCVGSQHLDTAFFENVGYVIGFDSPDINRNAYACSGQLLFSKDFYNNQLKDVCDKYGRKVFKSEPITDVMEIRKKTDITCMNFGSGYYNQHTNYEYIILEEVDDSICFAYDLIEKLGNKLYSLKRDIKVGGYQNGHYDNKLKKWVYDEENSEFKEDFNFLKTLDPSSTYIGKTYGYGSYYNGYDDDDYGYERYSSYASYSSTEKTKTFVTDEEVIEFVMDRYDERIKTIKNQVEAKCKALGISFETEMASIFSEDINF